jgi:hypothetical protein
MDFYSSAIYSMLFNLGRYFLFRNLFEFGTLKPRIPKNGLNHTNRNHTIHENGVVFIVRIKNYYIWLHSLPNHTINKRKGNPKL